MINNAENLSAKTYRKLRLILGDQLNASHSWFSDICKDTLYLIAELKQETDYVKHHVQKVCAFFSAMEAFASALKNSGHHVCYLTLDETNCFQDLPALINHLVALHECQVFEYQQPDELRLAQQLACFNLPSDVFRHQVSTEHFLLPFEEIPNFFQENKRHRMESFYRKMRQRFDILMDNDEPEGGKWNYDQNNREKLKAHDISNLIEPIVFANDISDILARLKRHNIKTIGRVGQVLLWPISRKQALEALHYFCQYCLPNFGRFQDAMTSNSVYKWSLYHSRLSFAMNAKMISPKRVIDTAIAAYRHDPKRISLSQIEGFVRQILGWREFIRGIYWANGEGYRHKNSLNAKRDLPSWFWTGKTKMHCLSQAIGQSVEFAYAHHIQRLMVTGNFALIAGIDPDQVEAWYLGIYIDAIEWVEQPNTRGMALFADGGLLASKPYAASGNYINKMSDYCSSCHYKIKEKTRNDACPLNALYWHFLATHKARFEQNPRTALTYKNWEKQGAEKQQAILNKAMSSLSDLESL